MSGFFQKFRPITISLSPNTEPDDVRLAFRLLFRPAQPAAVQELTEKMKAYLGVKYAFAFNSGRTSLMAILAALEIKKGEEVLLQGFTCNSAVNPILARGAKPVFIDIDKTLNLDPRDLEKKITSRSRAIMIQHTFGCPAQVEEILLIAAKHGLMVIEDCAHSLGAKYKGRLCGGFGDVAFFSFGRDKIISSVYGGMAVTDNQVLAAKIAEFQKESKEASRAWTYQQLLHPVLMNYLILPLYNLFNLGKVFLIASHLFNFLSKAVHKKEKQGLIPDCFPRQLPASLAALALNQLAKLERFNRHRQEIARIYKKELGKGVTAEGNVFMRYPILVANSDKMLSAARAAGIILNDGWRKTVIVPPDTDQEAMGYLPGSCPQAEKIAQSIVNLPTHINISPAAAVRIAGFLKDNNLV
ncbi:MAG: DegT/DnrJ/EryC1/StrS family aminotransferase [bacterium]